MDRPRLESFSKEIERDFLKKNQTPNTFKTLSHTHTHN